MDHLENLHFSSHAMKESQIIQKTMYLIISDKLNIYFWICISTILHYMTIMYKYLFYDGPVQTMYIMLYCSRNTFHWFQKMLDCKILKHPFIRDNKYFTFL